MSARELARVIRHGSQDEITAFIEKFDFGTVSLNSVKYHGIYRLIKKYARRNEGAICLERALRGMKERKEAYMNRLIRQLTSSNEKTRQNAIDVCTIRKPRYGLSRAELKELLETYTYWGEDEKLTMDSEEFELQCLVRSETPDSTIPKPIDFSQECGRSTRFEVYINRLKRLGEYCKFNPHDNGNQSICTMRGCEKCPFTV